MTRWIFSGVLAWIVVMASSAVTAQTESQRAGVDPQPSTTSPNAQEQTAESKAEEPPDQEKGLAPPAGAKVEPADDKQLPPPTSTEGTKADAEKKVEQPAAKQTQPTRKPDPSAKPSAVFQSGRPRHFLARFHGEIIGRMIWDVTPQPRFGGRLERAEREIFTSDEMKIGVRCNVVERQLGEASDFKTLWGTVRDVYLNGNFRLQGAGEEAKIKIASGMQTSMDVSFPTPADYRPMADVSSWCAKHRDEKGKTYTYSRPLWFSTSSPWGELAITAEGADPVLMEDGGALRAWRFRVRFAKTPDVYALLWLDAEGRPVRRELPFCGLSFIGCDKRTYDDLPKVMSWKDAQSKWRLPNDRMTAEILCLVHDHIEKAQAEGSSWGGGLSPEELIGTEAEAEAKLGLFLYFL